MFGFLLFGTFFTLLILVGGLVALRRTVRGSSERGSSRRTRSEARVIQARFEDDADFTQNFQRPTQNEVLETLQMLDHLSPKWDQGEAALVERRLKNELAESFPTLCKAGCIYPQAVARRTAHAFGRKRDAASQTARARQEFRTERAQANALHQLTSDVDVGPVAVVPGSLPFRISEEVQSSGAGQSIKWIMPLVAMLALAAVGWHFVGGSQRWGSFIASFTTSGNAKASGFSPPRDPTPRPDPATSKPTATSSLATVDGNAPPNSPTPSPSIAPVLAEATAALTEPTPTSSVPLSPLPPKADNALAEGVAESKTRAVDKYPDLAVPNTEINIRFVFRYKALLAEKSPRLQDPNWPEELADECAKSANSTSKGKRNTVSVTRSY